MESNYMQNKWAETICTYIFFIFNHCSFQPDRQNKQKERACHHEKVEEEDKGEEGQEEGLPEDRPDEVKGLLELLQVVSF